MLKRGDERAAITFWWLEINKVAHSEGRNPERKNTS